MMVVVFRGTLLIMGGAAGVVPFVVMRPGFPGTMHHRRHFARITANELCVEPDEDSNQQYP